METPEKEDIGQELRENNEKIVECILLLRDQRDELGFIIERQYEERKKLETEMERITYKLCLVRIFKGNLYLSKFKLRLITEEHHIIVQNSREINNWGEYLANDQKFIPDALKFIDIVRHINKSLAQRIKAKQDYDNTLNEIESNYAKLVKDSGDLLLMIKKEFEKLDSMINKRTSTDDAPKYENYEAGKANGSGEQIQEIDQFGSDINRGTSRGTSQGTNQQHGFCSSRSTVSNLQAYQGFLLDALEKGKQVDTFHKDFSKAFDRVDHKILSEEVSSQHCRCKPKPVQENTNESSELEIPTKEEPEPEDPSKSTSIIDKQRKRSTLSDDRRPRIMDRIPSSHNEI
ncbi:unnamed protein product [Phaedon cochleariae]|uniref:Uncharacterized protein n=1 Tax=Phaedon cochleariae TaxID=80249 RepID=A0A9N9X3E4_PHACE|nr:unnamed protein product [Phaedon cochleariae]